MTTLSVLLANFNHGRYLPAAIEGILCQTRPPDEFLILDDASTDDSPAVIESFAARHPVIRVLRNERNLGVIASQKRLLGETRAEYVYLGAADDERPPTFFARALEMAGRHPQAGLVCGQVVSFDETGRTLATIGVRRWREPLFAPPERFLHECLEVEAPSHSVSGATIWRRAALAEIGGFPDQLESWADTFALRAVGLRHGVCYVPEPFLRWRVLSTSYSGRSRGDLRLQRGLVERAAALMRSAPFRDIFPEAHVRRWRRRHLRQIRIQQWFGERMVRRLATVLRKLSPTR